MTGVSNLNSENRGESIEALGWVSEDKKIDLIKEADFLLMPSEFEGSSMTVIDSIVAVFRVLFLWLIGRRSGLNR